MDFVYLPGFVKKLKEYSKKYPSLKNDFETLLTQLKLNPKTGSALGRDCFKIRLGIKSKGKGKSGGMRVITCLKITQDSIYFLTIYDKSEQDTITDTDLKVFIEYIQHIK
jgi:hypothetical protein